MMAFFRPSRWSIPTMPADILLRTSRPWLSILWHNDGRSIYSLPTSTWWLTPIKALKFWTTYHILFSISSTGTTRHGRLTNTLMPLRHAFPSASVDSSSRSFWHWVAGTHTEYPSWTPIFLTDQNVYILRVPSHTLPAEPKRIFAPPRLFKLFFTEWIVFHRSFVLFVIWLFIIECQRQFGLQTKFNFIESPLPWRPIRLMIWTCPATNLLQRHRRPLRITTVSRMILPRLSTSLVWHALFLTPLPFIQSLSRRSPTLWHHDKLNCGSWNALRMDWKIGDLSRPSWVTSNSHKITEYFERRLINGAFIMTFLQSQPPLHPPFILYYLILNIPMYISDNLSPPSRTTPTYCNHAGDAQRSIILKALLYRSTGHHGVQLLRPHRQEHRHEWPQHTLWLRHPQSLFLEIHNMTRTLRLTCPTPVYNNPGRSMAVKRILLTVLFHPSSIYPDSEHSSWVVQHRFWETYIS